MAARCCVVTPASHVSLPFSTCPRLLAFTYFCQAARFEGVTCHWLRWYDDKENWLPTDAERAIQAEAQLRQVALHLLQQGMTVEQVAHLTGLALEQVQGMGNGC